jgi:NADPH:quinone reductase-like Zn-dependent oxidoreductase
MRAGVVSSFDPDNPLNGLSIIDVPEPENREHWTTVDVKAASINHHDVWSLRGVGLREQQLPMVLGTDAAGTTPDGRRVLVHAAIGVDGHGVGPRERRSILSEKFPGALAERVSVPTANLIDITDDMPFEIAACLPTAWLTAYALLFRGAGLTPGQSVLIQGAGGGVASAAIILARAAGVTVYATSRSAAKLHRACELGAIPIEHGERLPQRVDAVVETVGKATWSHSVASVKPGGIIAIAGATTGDATAAELTRIFFQEIRVQGVTLGTRDELTALVNFVAYNKISVPIDSIYTLTQLPQALGKMIDGNLFGKVVIVMETQ